MALFERFVGMLADFTPTLSFFSRSKELFNKDSKGLEAAVEAVCKDMVLICLKVTRYCQRHPIGNYSKVI